MAAIIEFAGQLPEPHTGFTATKGGNQGYFKDEKIALRCEKEYRTLLGISRVTLITTYGEKVRLLQSGNKKIYPVNELFLNLVDNSKIEREKGEETARGPYLAPEGKVVWENNIMVLRVHPEKDENYEKLLPHLEIFSEGIV